MIFKSSTVALVVSAAFVCSANASEAQQANNLLAAEELSTSVSPTTELTSSFVTSHQTMGVYIIRLSAKSGLDPAHASLGSDLSSVLPAIEQQQDSVMTAIRSADASAVLTRKARLTENALYVQMSHEAAEELAANVNVVSIELLNEEPAYTSDNEFKKYPFLEMKDAGDAITVAIIGNGIDYTHKSLGGSGERADYEQAYKNRTNAWDGFPTDTVIGGLDFGAAGEGYHSLDYNPIEDELDVNVESGALASGTAVAAQVLAQAPDAKIIYYKTYDWSSAYFYPVLDAIIDPNQDGDISDRPDVIVMNSFGNSAFYVEDDTAMSGATRDIGLVRRVSAAGSLLVIGAGYTANDSYFNLAWRAAVPEALTVGSVSVEGDSVTLSPWTPAGPTRGTQNLKPEVVAPAEHFMGPVAGGGEELIEVMPHHNYAAAYAAGTAAKILAQFPQLSPIEAKALVANTAIADGIQGSTGEIFEGFQKTTVPEVSFMGTGLVDGATAVTANAVIWESGTYQPGLAFGFVETPGSVAISRDLTIKNLTDEVQTYTITSKLNGNKASNEAISFIYPQVINIPANRSVTFPVTLTVNAEKIGEWPFKQGTDGNIENWIEAAVNGYLTFNNSNADSAELNVPFQLFPKNSQDLTKSNGTYLGGAPLANDDYNQKVYNSGGWMSGQVVDVKNDTNASKTLMAMPLMHHVDNVSPSKVGGQGNMIQNIGANVVDEAMCEITGKKLSIAVQMFDDFDQPMAEHFDKAGHKLTWFKAYTEEHADAYNDSPFEAEQQSTDADKIFVVDVATDNHGELQASYVDLNMEFNPWFPRWKVSKLATDVSTGDDTVVVNICLEDLYHHDIQSVEDFDQYMGWQFATDRDAQADIRSDLIRYNPIINGMYSEEIVDHTGEDGYPNWWDSNCQPKSWNPDNCIEQQVNFLSTVAGIKAHSADFDASETFDWSGWSNKVILASGDSARVYGGLTSQCDPSTVTSGAFYETHEDCPPGIMYFEIGNNNTSYSAEQLFGTDTRIAVDQGYSVYENADNGTVVAQLELTSNNFFFVTKGYGDVRLVNALPGTPFHVSTDGVITVANADALDYEETKSYTLKINVDHVNRDSIVVDVVVAVNNSNDVAPLMVNGIADVVVTTGEQVSANVASSFTDIEGDGITFTASDLPTGLTISLAGKISGIATVAGDYSATITAHDGVNSTATDMSFSISGAPVETTPVETAPVGTTPVNSAPSNSSPTAAEPADDTQSSGGSTGLLFLLISSLGFAARRANK